MAGNLRVFIWLLSFATIFSMGCTYVDRGNAREFTEGETRFAALTGDMIRNYVKSKTPGNWKFRIASLEVIPGFDLNISEDLLQDKMKIIYVDKPELGSLAATLKNVGGEIRFSQIVQPTEATAYISISSPYWEIGKDTANRIVKKQNLPFEFSSKESSAGELVLYLFFQNDPPVFTKEGIEPDTKLGHRILDHSVRVSLFLYENGKKPGIESFRCQKRILTEYPSDWFLRDWFFPKTAENPAQVLFGKGIQVRKNEEKISSEKISLELVLSECFQELAKASRP